MGVREKGVGHDKEPWWSPLIVVDSGWSWDEEGLGNKIVASQQGYSGWWH